MKNYTKFAIRGAVTVLVITILSALLGYLVRFILARNLSVEEFGLFYSVFSFLGMFMFIKSLGLERSLIKFIPEFQYHKKDYYIKNLIIYVAIIQIIMNSIIIVGIYSFSNYLSLNFFHSPQANIVLRLMSIAFFIDNFTFILKFSFQGFQKMTLFSIMDFIRMLLLLVIILIGFKLTYGILSPVIAYILVPILLIVIFTPILTNKIFPEFYKSKIVFNIPLIKKFIKYGIYVIEGDLGWLILGYTDIITLTYFTGLISVGLYNVALPTANLLIYFPKAAASVLLPLSSELWIKKKKIFLKAGMDLLYKYSIILIIPLVFIVFSFTDILISLLYGAKYLPAGTAMKILSIGMIFATIYILNATFLVGIGKPKISSRIVYIGAALNLIGNLALIPVIGMIGAAITTSLSYFLMVIIGIIEVRKFIKLTIPIKIWIKSFIAGTIFVISIEILKRIFQLNVWIETAIILTISGIFYILILFLFKIIDVNELKDLYKRCGFQ